METSSDLPPSLRDAIANRRLLVFGGAGISNLAPSNLPDWTGFNEGLFEEVKTSALELPLDPEACAAIRRLTLAPIPVQAFSDLLVDMFSGDDYFPLVTVLDSNAPNANHQALVALARAGILRAVVTTNFDTLIEQSFRQMGIELDTFVSRDDYLRAQDPKRCGLYKIHGSVKSVPSLVDTVKQKLEGLPLYVRTRLAQLFRQYHVLVLGFSGSDLKFGHDYAAFSAINSQSPGLTWVLRPGSSLTEVVQDVLNNAGGYPPITANLPQFFENLGLEIEPSVTANSASANEDATHRARLRMHEIFEQLSVSSFRSAMFCWSLLQHLEWQAAANAVARCMAANFAEVRSADTYGAAMVATFLARNAMENGDMAGIATWAGKVMEISTAELARLSTLDDGPTREERRSWQRIQSGAWSDLGMTHFNTGEQTAAVDALQKAAALAKAAECHGLLSKTLLNLSVAEQNLERKLALVRTATCLAAEASHAQGLCTAADSEAKVLTLLGEYDLACAALDRAREHLANGGAPQRMATLIETTHADLERRRGKFQAACDRLIHCAESLDEHHPLLAAQKRIELFHALAFHAPLRPRIIQQLELVQTAMQSGKFPAGGEAHPFPSLAEIESLVSQLRTDAVPRAPGFLQYGPAVGSREECIERVRLMFHELEGHEAELPAYFDRLSQAKYQERDPRRLLDLSLALVQASERVADRDRWTEGMLRTGISRSLLGDTRGAVDAYHRILALNPPAPKPVWTTCCQDLGIEYSRLGDAAQSERFFAEAFTLCTELGDADRALAAHVRYAQARERLGDPAGGLRALRTLPDPDAPTDGGKPVSKLIAEFEQHPALRSSAIRKLPPALEPRSDPAPTLQELHELREQVSSPQELSELAMEALAAGQPALARTFLLDAQHQFSVRGNFRELARCFLRRSRVEQSEGHWFYAIELINWAIGFQKRFDEDADALEPQSMLAFCLFATGQLEEAGDAAQRILIIVRDQPLSSSALIAWYVLAEVLRQVGDPAQFRAMLRGFLTSHSADVGHSALAWLRNYFASALAGDLARNELA